MTCFKGVSIMDVCVLSSWDTPQHGAVVDALRDKGHNVFDYRTLPDGRLWDMATASRPEWGPQPSKVLLCSETVFKINCAQVHAVSDADVVVLVTPANPEAYLQFGMVIDSPYHRTLVLMDGQTPPFPSFHRVNEVCWDIAHLVAKVEEMAEAVDMVSCIEFASPFATV